MEDIIKVLNMWYSIYEGENPEDVKSSMIYDMFASDPVKMLGCAVYMFEHKLPASYLKSFICKGNITSMVDRMSNAFSSQSDEVKQKQIFRFTIDAQNGCMMLGKTKELEKGIILL